MDCQYCGKPAGFLKRQHPECAGRREEALRLAKQMVKDAARAGKTWNEVAAGIDETMRGGHVSRDRLPQLLLIGLCEAVEHVLDDAILDEDEERCVSRFLQSAMAAGHGGDDFPAIAQRLDQAAVIRLALQGENPARKQGPVEMSGFDFMESEAPIWSFQHVSYSILETRVRDTGSSRGVGSRAAKGVYVRTGGFRGERIAEDERRDADDGQIVITTKHLYFKGHTHRFRVRHDRVVSYEPLRDGFELTRDHANAKPERFVTGDGWFVYNLLINARNIGEPGP